jgi:hypothetical protein
MPRRTALTAALALAVLAGGAPASAAAKRCGAVKGTGSTSITDVRTSSGGCPAAKALAKRFANSRVAPRGTTCKERFSQTTKAAVTCRTGARTVRFRVHWKSGMPLPPAVANPLVGGGGG